MGSTWSKSELTELRHHLRLLWISCDPVDASKDDAYDDYVDEALKLCIDKKPVGELIGFIDWVTYKKFNRVRTVDGDEANAVFAKKILAWYRDCQVLAGPVGDEEG
ncbi:MAG TPA: hypothetical protein VNU97_00095 [Rhizomicrobium sp.]|jgi:hypothetical protein|nr:hypothetical protein [Rhizomicrobium sp.]